MGQCVRGMVLLLVTLAIGPGLVISRNDLARDRRQSGWWNVPQSETGWGSSRMNGGVLGRSRQLQLSSSHPIRVQCMEDLMVVTVQADLYGIGKPVKASDLSLGPGRCRPSSQSTTTTVIFQQKLQECGNTLQMTNDWLIYNTGLNYSPSPARNSPIIRNNPAVIPIQCYYLRHGNVSSNAIKPTWVPFSSTISAEERLSFSLKLMEGDWRTPHTAKLFQLGDIFNIEASVDTRNHVPMKVFIDRCVATLSPDIASSPSYEIINQNGCLMDGRQDDASSAFRSPRPSPDRIQFTVDAFRFFGSDNSMIYITCNLRATAQNKVPDRLNKACSFSKSRNLWTDLEGPGDICTCCDSRNCLVGQHRMIKRSAVSGQSSQQERISATLGPLLVVGVDQSKVLPVTQPSGFLELWVLGATASLCLAVIMVSGVAVFRQNRSSIREMTKLAVPNLKQVAVIDICEHHVPTAGKSCEDKNACQR